MSHFVFVAAIAIGSFFIGPSGFAESKAAEWKWFARGQDFELFVKPSARPSALKAFRLVGTLPVAPRDVAIGILDRDHRPLWMRDILELRTVRLPSPGVVVEYSAIRTPFVIKDRDFLVRTEVSVDARGQVFVITTRSVEDETVPHQSRVRGELIEGKFVISPGAENGTSKIVADMDVDPKGSVPQWMVNHFQKNWPAVMFRSLKNFLALKTATLPPDLVALFQ